MSLTNLDFKKLRVLVEDVFDYKLEEKLESKLEEKLTQKLGKYPNKDEFYEETLKMLTKLDNIETQMTMLSGRTYDNTEKIEKLETLI